MSLYILDSNGSITPQKGKSLPDLRNALLVFIGCPFSLFIYTQVILNMNNSSYFYFLELYLSYADTILFVET